MIFSAAELQRTRQVKQLCQIYINKVHVSNSDFKIAILHICILDICFFQATWLFHNRLMCLNAVYDHCIGQLAKLISTGTTKGLKVYLQFTTVAISIFL